MSVEYNPQTQAELLGVRLDQTIVAVKGLVAAYHMLHTHPEVSAEMMGPMDAKLAEIASMATDAVGLYAPTSDAGPGESEDVAATADQSAAAQGVVAKPTREPRAHDGVAELPRAEITANPVSIDLTHEKIVVINGKEVALTKYDKAILHALAVVDGDMVMPEDICLVARATTAYEVGITKDIRRSAVRLARRIEQTLGYGVIRISEVQGADGMVMRFGLAQAPGSTYECDIEPPAMDSAAPRLTDSGDVEGSLFGGFIRLDDTSPDVPDSPIIIEVLSNDLLYINDGGEGRAVVVSGNKLFAANALLAIGGMASSAEIKVLAQKTGDANDSLLTKISDYEASLQKLLGQSQGKAIVVRSGSTTRDLAYGFHSDVLIVDRRGSKVQKTDSESQPLAETGRAGQPAPAEGAADNPLGGKYSAVIENFESLGDGDTQPQDDVEQLIGELVGVETDIVRDMLTLHRLSTVLGISFAPDEKLDADGFAQHKTRVYSVIDQALRSAEFLNPKSKLSELSVLALHLGLPDEIQFLHDREVTLANRNSTYKYALEQVRKVGLSFGKMRVILSAEAKEEAVASTFERAVSKLRDQLGAD